jgi:5-methylcytosine-specific restriction endonuclease McrA
VPSYYGHVKKTRDKTKTLTIDHLKPTGWFRKEGHVLYCVNPSLNNLVIACEACNNERGSVLDDGNKKVPVSVIDKWNRIHLSKSLSQFVVQRKWYDDYGNLKVLKAHQICETINV